MVNDHSIRCVRDEAMKEDNALLAILPPITLCVDFAFISRMGSPLAIPQEALIVFGID